MKIKIKVVFDDWRIKGKSIYNTEEGVKLSSGDFHSGTTFDGEIELDADQLEEFDKAFRDGYTPVFWVSREMDKRI